LAFYGSDLDEINTAAHGRLRGEIGVDSGVRIIGMVAFMYAPKLYLGQSRGIKGHEDLIDAFDIVQRAEPKTICVMVGGAWDGADAYERKVREYARRKCGDAVLFLGTRNDVHYLYPDFDVVVHPSLSENLGGAAESLLHGIPTIATNVGGLPDLVADGKTGWLVPPHDPQRLADAIQEALSDPEEARQRAERGQTLAQNLLDVGQTARQVYDIYHKILAET
jgi:glycosyltransferase involved in cell wall biosynthesis